MTTATSVALAERREDLADAVELGVVVGDGEGNTGDAGVVKELAGTAGVFAADERDRGEDFDRAG